ncbi:MAG: choice-of-anchor H family protein, partial [Calditrichaeota bacterium]|nr:choice-of-anchor H family protein [Calditrichota bacterium]
MKRIVYILLLTLVLFTCTERIADKDDNSPFFKFITINNVIDVDGDSYAQSAELKYSLDYIGDIISDSLIIVLYKKRLSDSVFTIYKQTDPFLISADTETIFLDTENSGIYHGIYEFKLHILKLPEANVILELDKNNIPILTNLKLETSNEDITDNSTYNISNISWSNLIDNDNDQYTSSRHLNATIATNSESSKVVYTLLEYFTDSYFVYSTTDTFSVSNGANHTVQILVGAPNPQLDHGIYDFRFTLFSANNENLISLNSATEPNLNDLKFENATEDILNPNYNISNISWSNLIDNDNDQYTSSRQLNATIATNSESSKVVYTLLEYFTDSYFVYSTTDTFSVSNGTNHTVQILVGAPNPQLDHGIYDFRFTLFSANDENLISLNSATELNLNDLKFENATEDIPVIEYYISNISWSNSIDNDSDQYTVSRELNFTISSNSQYNQNVYISVDYLNASYIRYITSDLFVISPENQISFNYTIVDDLLSKNLYDFKINLHKAETGEILEYINGDNNTQLKSVKFENASQDAVVEFQILPAQWSSTIDGDIDSWAKSRKLNFRVTGGYDPPDIFAKIYYSDWPANAPYMHYYTLSPVVFSYIHDFEVTIGSPNLELSFASYDFKIELLYAADSSLIAAQTFSENSDLNDVRFETSTEDTISIVQISDMWWSDIIDNDGDGYRQAGTL